MVVFPNCKINLGLNITHKREDGYHDLETVFYPVPLCDALEVNRSTDKDNYFIFNQSGLLVNGKTSDNICVKAYHLLKADFPALPNVNIHLHKTIPMGAGLGGGSSNGAFTLQLLNKKFNLQLSQEQLIHYALRLGSDCPFFILNEPCYATGRGELMEPLQFSLKGYSLLLANPGIHISTKEAFAGITPHRPSVNVREIITTPIETWKDQLVNDFEQTAFRLHPVLSKIKNGLYRNGAVYASMTGTGSTVFGIFKSSIKIDLIFEDQLFVRLIEL